MEKVFKRLGCGILVLFFTFAFLGCSMKLGSFEPNSHFAFPNSNVTPLGQVSAEVSRTSFFIAKVVDKEMLDEVLNKALKEKGGDVLINYKLTTTVTTFPIIPIIITSIRVDGTACKMTIGRQELK